MYAYVKSSPPGQNGGHFGRQHFQMHFPEWKLEQLERLGSEDTPAASWVMLDPSSQNKVEWPWRYWSRSKVMTCNTPPHASDHLYQIWKESMQNCRFFFKVKAEKFQIFRFCKKT